MFVYYMPLSNQKYTYVAFVDEAGDPGLRKVRPLDPDGSSEWLILGALLVQAPNEENIVSWMDDIRKELGVDRNGPLHFRKLSTTRRQRAAELIGILPARGFVVCSNKKNMKGYRNLRAERMDSQEWFYNWMIRLLLERITAYCHNRARRRGEDSNFKIKIVFSRRGGHRYSQTRAYTLYLKQQNNTDALLLNKRAIFDEHLDVSLMLHEPHWAVPGLQLADTVASAFYIAANTIGPGGWDTSAAKALKRIMALENNNHAGFGVSLHPTPAWKANLTDEQQSIFRYYGYDFSRR